MILNKTKVSEKIAKMGYDASILKLINGEGKDVHYLLKYQCYEPKYVYEIDVTPYGKEVIPLWEKGNKTTAFWEKDDEIEYIKFDTEFPDKYKPIGKSIQAVIADILVWLWSDEDEEDIRKIAKGLNFKYIDDLISGLESVETYDEQKEWLNNFLWSLND